MTIEIFDDFFNLFRASFLLFYAIVFYYIYFWRLTVEPQIIRRISLYFFIILLLNFSLNLTILFRDFLVGIYLYISAIIVAIIGEVIFWTYKKHSGKRLYYLHLPVIFAIFSFLGHYNFLIPAGLFFIGIFFFYASYAEKSNNSKSFIVVPFFIRKDIFLPFVLFGFYLFSLSLYMLTNALIFNILSFFFVFLGLTIRIKVLYEQRIKAYILYILAYFLVVYFIFLIGFSYIKKTYEISVEQKKLTLQRLALEVKDKIYFYGDFVKVISSSKDLKEKIIKGKDELNAYLTFLNQILDTEVIFFIDKFGTVKGCSYEYRDIMLNQKLNYREYFREAIEGNLSVFIGRGVFTKRDDIRIASPVYDKNEILGVIVAQFDISKNFKNQIASENAFLMHSSGAVLIGREDLKDRFILNPSQTQIERLQSEKVFGNDAVRLSPFKQIGNNTFEFNGERLELIKESILSEEWYLASFVSLNLFDNYKYILYLAVIVLSFIFHTVTVRSLENIRRLFISIAEEAEERRIAFNALDMGLFYVDVQGKIKHINKEALKLLEISEEEAFGRRLTDIISLKDHPNPEYKILTTGKKEIPVIYVEHPIILNNVKFGDVITIKDASEIIQRQELAKKVERMDLITRISSGIVHDFNNYLFVLTGNLSLLRETIVEEKNKKIIERMLESTKSMANIIEELRDLSADYVTKREYVDIVRIINNCLEFILDGTNIKFRVSYDDPLPKIYANSGQIYRIFQNLVVNAKQAMKNEGEIEISIKEIFNKGDIKGIFQGKYLQVILKDNGPGIPPEFLDKIFDPFFTLKREGKGLGLSIVKNILEKLGGTIQVESELGRGTTFKIYIPVSEDFQFNQNIP